MHKFRLIPSIAVCLALLACPAFAVEVTFTHQAPGAAQVFLAGEFNGWSDSADPMANKDGVWTLVLDLEPGDYQYKFVVDGSWVHDPTNPNTAEDGFGGKNSLAKVPAGAEAYAVGADAGDAGAEKPLTTGVAAKSCKVTFKYSDPGAGSVNLAGEFNGWSDSADPMANKDGVWTLTLDLEPGQYQYKFVADGQWKQDPANPLAADDGFGGKNSVLKVPFGKDAMDASSGAPAAPSGGAAATGPAPVDDGTMRSVEFVYVPVISGVNNVFLAGSFNDWNDSKTRMTDSDGDGSYTVSLLLPQGTYQYKFVVDGQWQQDPNNPEGADDGFGGQNSVLRVDSSFSTIEIELGDGKIFSDDLEPVFDYSTCNPLTPTDISLTARAHLDDVEGVGVEYTIDGGAVRIAELQPVEKDAAYQYYRTTIGLDDAGDRLEYVFRYRDGERLEYLGPRGMSEARPAPGFVYTREEFPPFFTPEWAKDGIIYQIFPERFANGDEGNDPDFSEPWYEGVHTLPASGKTNGEYFHLVEDWYDVGGLVRSPYRTDGKPDYYSFYGGDIAGIRQKLDYLNDLGVTVIYFNPLNQGMSNHKYDPVDYLKIDPHFASEDEFKAFVQDCHARGIRIVVDVAFNHTGNWHFAFRDAVEKGPDSPYYKWYEFKRWPLPAGRDIPNASDYYDCWWGFGLHPNLNFDLTRSNANENNIDDVEDADPNWPVVEYVLSVADKWLGEYDIDGFRLDVPNEVPHWFWALWNERCKSIKPDCWLVGELWGNAGRWIGPRGFDSTMNYKFFRDPVMDYCGKGVIDAATFDQRLSPGRFQYPPQSVAVMMNLIDSHDTIRFLTSAGDVRRLMLGAMFSMTYVGMPHIWYGDEVGMTGGKDPDCRRPFDWRYEGNPRAVALRDYYGKITRLRRDTPVLARGSFTTLATVGKGYAYARALDGKLAVVLLNAGDAPVTLDLPGEVLANLADGGGLNLDVVVGPETFPRAAGASCATGDKLDLSGNKTVTVTLPGLSGAVLLN
ncbi:MAG: alpha-amylase family glycosyl hydrolase [bacterium]